jgi:hypothetical protein
LQGDSELSGESAEIRKEVFVVANDELRLSDMMPVHRKMEYNRCHGRGGRRKRRPYKTRSLTLNVVDLSDRIPFSF